MPGKRGVTINDIARLANVSKATVSRVLNHKPDVDLETRERVLRIVEDQGAGEDHDLPEPSLCPPHGALARAKLLTKV